MYQQTKFFILASLTLVGMETLAVAQPLPHHSRPPMAPARVAPAQSSSFSGTVDRYLLNREGVVDGLLLDNGLQVKFPPHMGDSLRATVKLGDRVRVTGTPGVASNLGQEIRAYSIANAETQRTVVDQPPQRPPQPPVRSSYENFSANGTAQRWLVGKRGEIKGIVLSSGTQVKFPRHVGLQLTNVARTGARIQAEGFGSRSRYGNVLEATSLTVDGQTIPLQSPVSGRPFPRLR